MIELLAPLGLAALAALALPVVIHFLRRAEEHELSFAALRWLSEQARTSTNLRLHERILLVLRLLLLATIALLLALPVWRDRTASGSAWIAVAPGVDIAAARAVVDVPDAQWHWLAPGFPDADATSPAPTASLSSLVRELDAQLPAATALTIVVPQELGGLDAERLQLARAVDWRVVAGSSPQETVRATSTPIAVAVRFAAESPDELQVVRALGRAWEVAGHPVRLDVASSGTAIPDDADWLVWLGGALSPPAQAWIGNGRVALVSQRAEEDGHVVLADGNGEVSLRERELGHGRLISTSGALTVAAMPALLAPDFPERLRVLMSAPDAAPDRASAEAMTPARAPGRMPGPGTPLERALALVAALLFLAERAWATRQRAWRT